MSISDLVSEVLYRTGPVTLILDEVIAEAIADADRDAARYPHETFPFLRSLLVRARSRQLLEDRGLPDGWQLDGNPRLMGQLIITRPGDIALRFLRGNPLQPNRVPPAGLTHARVQAWTQDPLPAHWPANPQTGQETKFLALWDYLNPEQRLEGFTLRLVHPIGTGKFQDNVPCDLDVAIPRGGTLFEDLEFLPKPEDEDLFAVRILDQDEEA